MLKFGSKSDINVTYKCTVRLLDDTEVLECEFLPHHKGTYLLEHVCKQLNLIEKDYFGLRFVDVSKQRHWLNLGKTVVKQIKDLNPILFSFRVKFYPPNPFILKEEITRYHIYLQLKRDLLHGRLYCNQNEAALMGAFIVQAELGDYDPEIHVGNYVSELKLLLKQTQRVEERILELHQTQLKGQTPLATENHFLKKACQLDTYGVDPHPVKNHKGNTLYLGINHLGVLTFRGRRKTRHFTWSEIQKINYEGKMFIIHVVYYEKKHTVGFKCPTAAACRYVWRCAVEQMLFFTLQKSEDAPVLTGGGLFSWRKKFKYSGRTEKEVLQDARYNRHADVETNSDGGLRRKASSVPATPSTPMESDLGEIRYSSLPRSKHSLSDSRINQDCTNFLTDCPEFSLSFLETVSEDQEHNVGQDNSQGVQDANETDEYHFRDSFDRSSCDSQLQDISKISLPLPQRPAGSHSPQFAYRFKQRGCPPSLRTTNLSRTVSMPLPSAHRPKDGPKQRNQSVAKFNLFQVFIFSFLFVAISLIAITILILESDSDLLNNVRGTPEMIALQKHYYEPMKEFVTKRVFNLLANKEI